MSVVSSKISDLNLNKERNRQLKQDLYKLVQEGDQNNTEFRLLREALQMPQEPRQNPKRQSFQTGANASSSIVENNLNYRIPSTSIPPPETHHQRDFSSRKFGTPIQGNHDARVPPSSKTTNQDQDRFTSLRRYVDEIKHTRYDLPSKTEASEHAWNHDNKRTSHKHELDSDIPQDTTDRKVAQLHKRVISRSSTVPESDNMKSKTEGNLLLKKLESKNEEIEQLNDEIKVLKLEKEKLSNKVFDANDQRLTSNKAHEREVERLNTLWRDRLHKEREASRKLQETTFQQSREIEALRMKVSRSEGRNNAAYAMKEKLEFLRNEYKRATKKIDELNDENYKLKKQQSKISSSTQQSEGTQHTNVSQEPGLYARQIYDGNSNDDDESTAELIAGYRTRDNEKGTDIEVSDSTTDFLIKGTIGSSGKLKD